MKNFLGKSVTSTIPFMDGTIDVRRLSVGETIKLQKSSKKIKADDPKAEEEHLKMILEVVKLSVEDAAELTDDEILSFPVDELTRIADTAFGNKSDAAGNDG